jgi:hypothetical protein
VTESREPAPRDPRPPSGEEAGHARPLIERVGLAAVAMFMAVLFGGMGVAAWVEGEGFLAVMGWLGSLMTIWVGGSSLLRR